MKYSLIPTVSLEDLEELVNIKFPNEDFDIRELFFPESMNDSYQSLYFGEDETIFSFEVDESTNRNKIRALLRKELPEYKRVLVDVSW